MQYQGSFIIYIAYRPTNISPCRWKRQNILLYTIRIGLVRGCKTSWECAVYLGTQWVMKLKMNNLLMLFNQVWMLYIFFGIKRMMMMNIIYKMAWLDITEDWNTIVCSRGDCQIVLQWFEICNDKETTIVNMLRELIWAVVSSKRYWRLICSASKNSNITRDWVGHNMSWFYL